MELLDVYKKILEKYEIEESSFLINDRGVVQVKEMILEGGERKKVSTGRVNE